jgi:hypothetical protein
VPSPVALDAQLLASLDDLTHNCPFKIEEPHFSIGVHTADALLYNGISR